MANSCGNGSCCDPRHCTWPQAWGSLTNGRKSLTFFIRLEVNGRWKRARFSSPTMALCQHGHTPLFSPFFLPWNPQSLRGKGKSPMFWGYKMTILLSCFQDSFFFSLWNSGTFLIQIDFYTRGYLNMVLNTEHHLSRKNDANCHLLSIYYMPGSSAGDL